MRFEKLRYILLFSFSIIGESFAAIYFQKGGPHVKLANGALLSGTVANSRDGRPYNSFVGIPYATVPERFAEPEPVKPWEGVRPAVQPGNLCPQNHFDKDGGAFGDEDCLNLNVYVPMNNTGRWGYPVMVWIHGGGFVFGGGYGYNGKFFMDEDVILITINYRLGVFGFMSTGDEVIPGNNGLKDQLAALKWVKANIKEFGGNPDRVTVFGESAGGASVHYLLLSPESKGLFQRAISQSSTALSTWAYETSPRKNAVELATFLDCPTTAPKKEDITSEEILTCLKGLSTDELNKAQKQYKSGWPLSIVSFSFVPTKEPENTATSKHTPFLTQSPWSILQDKTHPLPEIPWIVGATEDEGTAMYAGVVLKDSELIKEMETEWQKIAPIAFDYAYLPLDERNIVSDKLKQFYFANKAVSLETRENLTNLYSDAMILHSVYRAAVDTASRGKRNPVYLYQYAYHGPISLMGMTLKLNDESLAKVGHGDELVHQFDFGSGSPESLGLIKPDTADEQFSKNLVKLWASFATQGEPKHSWGIATYRKWKSISRKELDGVYPLRWFRIDSNPVQSIDNPYQERMQFWDQLWEEHFGPACSAIQPNGSVLASEVAKNSEKTEL